jgi:hypothetical protein
MVVLLGHPAVEKLSCGSDDIAVNLDVETAFWGWTGAVVAGFVSPVLDV